MIVLLDKDMSSKNRTSFWCNRLKKRVSVCLFVVVVVVVVFFGGRPFVCFDL